MKKLWLSLIAFCSLLFIFSSSNHINVQASQNYQAKGVIVIDGLLKEIEDGVNVVDGKQPYKSIKENLGLVDPNINYITLNVTKDGKISGKFELKKISAEYNRQGEGSNYFSFTLTKNIEYDFDLFYQDF